VSLTLPIHLQSGIVGGAALTFDAACQTRGLMTMRALFSLLMVAVMGIGCGGDDSSSGGDGDGSSGSTIIDGGTLYNVETIACTEDVDCDNGVFCDGQEVCDNDICVGGQRVVCDDAVDCTRDRCDEEAAACVSTPPDLDADGHADGLCLDIDGLPLGDDCDDTDRSRFPGNVEYCDDEGHDEDCDLSTFGVRDQDLDGYGDATCCNRDGDTLNCGDDCNDLLRAQNPDTAEVCDGFDNNCDGEVDEGLTILGFVDGDRDRFGAGPEVPFCPGTPGYAVQDGDCNDDERMVNPGLNELCSDGVDNNCDDKVDDGFVPSTWYRDVDGDGFGNVLGGVEMSCEIVPGYALYGNDCSDGDPLSFPGADERCDGLDNDCNGSADHIVGPDNLEDDDGDGAPDFLCGLFYSDCNDNAALVYPGAPELCDNVDNDCNGVIDGLVDEAQWYVDNDGDGYGDDRQAPIVSCELMLDRVQRGGDCDDGKADVHENQLDGCNMTADQDDDCDGLIDEDAIVAAFYFDPDNDGYGAGPALLACAPPEDYTDRAGDCEEGNPARYPGADESCSAPDGIDNDCDLLVDCADPDCWVGNDCDNQGALVVTLPMNHSRVVTREIDVTISLRDDVQDPVAGATVILAASPGAIFDTVDAVTDVNGEVVGRIRLGPKPGNQVFTASTPGVRTQSVTIVAQAPADGTITTLVNAKRVVDDFASPIVDGSPSIETPIYRAFDMDVASDGTVYFADHYARVNRVSPEGVIERVAGTGTGANAGDLGDARAAVINNPRAVALDEPGNRLFVSTTDRVRVVSFDTGKIDTVTGTAGISRVESLAVTPGGQLMMLESQTSNASLSVVDPGTGDTTQLAARDCSQPASLNGCYYSRCDFALTPDGEGIYMSGQTCGTEVTGTPYGVVYANLQKDLQGRIIGLDGFRRAAGGTGGIAIHTLVPDGRLAGEAVTFPTREPGGVAVDPSGGVLVSTGTAWNQLVRVDHTSGLVEHFAGRGAAPTDEGDFFPAKDASLSTPYGLKFDPDGNLLIADFDRGSIRKVWGAARSMPDAIDLSLTAGGGQSLYLNQESASVAFTMTQDGDPVAGRTVHFEMTPAAGVVAAPTGPTNVDGAAFSSGYVGLLPGDYDIAATVYDLRGGIAEQANVTIGAVQPDVGWVYPIVNVGYAAKGNSHGVAAPFARPDRIYYGLEASDDGRIFFTGVSQYSIHAIGTDGVVRRIAGTGSQSGILTSGPSVEDGNPAILHPMRDVSFLALDDDNELLYVLSDGPRIRVLDLSTGIIDHFYDLSPHGAIRAMQVDVDGGLLLVDATNLAVVRINPDGSLDAVGSYPLNDPALTCADDLMLVNCGVPGGGALENKMCSARFLDDGSVILTARFCGSGINYLSGGGFSPGAIARRHPDGTWERIAGIQGGTGFTEGILALGHNIGPAGSYITLGTMTVDARGWIFYADNYYDNRIRGISPDGNIYSVFGGASGPSGDWGPAVDAGGGVTADTIGHMAIDADGNLLIAADSTIRRVVLPD